MARVDSTLYHQKGGGLFRILGEMTAQTQEKYPGRPIVKLGVGDVTLPLAPAILEALHAAHREDLIGTGPGCLLPPPGAKRAAPVKKPKTTRPVPEKRLHKAKRHR